MTGRKKVYDLESRRRNDAGATIDDELFFNLRNIHRTMHALCQGKASWQRALVKLDQTGPITQKELTERLSIQPASASDILAKMEGMGLIRRVPSTGDQRTMDVFLTEEGRAQAAEAREQRRQRHQEMFACLSEEEKSDLLFLLEKVNEDWAKRYQL